MHHLLHVEELKMQVDIQQFDMPSSPLIKNSNYIALHVPGLAESRPSVLRGDQVLVSRPGGGGKKWSGYAHRIEQDQVLLKFSMGFHASFIDRSRFDVEFTFRRTPLRLMHQGLDKTSDPEFPREILFPPSIVREDPPRSFVPGGGDRLVFFNHSMNEEQQDAVRRIVAGRVTHVPYVLFGPPGTGKTTTLVETILQLAKTSPPSFRILVMAPTNTASDIFVVRMKEALNKSEMHRVMAYQRSDAGVSEDVKKYCNFDRESNAFPMLPVEKLKTFKVLVATTCTAAKLFNAGFERGDFAMMCIDECGNDVEPGVMAPIECLLASGQQLVLAGDPRQLGPVVRSPFASLHGLSTSLLERVMDFPIYALSPDGKYDPRVLTMLVKNYRSHPHIIAVPNERFYGSALQVCGDPALITSLQRWEHLPTQGVPLIFHSIQGDNEREANSPSWFNRAECQQVNTYVQLLMKQTRPALLPSQIGIITPYAKMAEKIRTTLRSQGVEVGGNGIMVGTTEIFQGQERRVIIISTVRSDPSLVEFDVRHNLGFLANPKRFNVAVTRAQALLIVVGDATLLARDPNWGALISYSISHGAFIGQRPEPNEDNMDQLAAQLQDLHMPANEENAADEDWEVVMQPSATELQEGPAWDRHE